MKIKDLFPDIKSLQKYLGGAISNSVEISEILPYLEPSIEQQIFPILGEEVICALETILKDPPVSKSPILITGVFRKEGTTGTWIRVIELYALEDVRFPGEFSIVTYHEGVDPGIDGEFAINEADLELFLAKGERYIIVNTQDANPFVDYFISELPNIFWDAPSNDLYIIGRGRAVLKYKDEEIDVFGKELPVGSYPIPWDITDGWAYRKDTSVTASNPFDADEWFYSGKNAISGETKNDEAEFPFPINTYSPILEKDWEEFRAEHPWIKENLLRAIAAFTVARYSEIAEIVLTSRGLLRQETTEFKPGFKYQINKYRESLLDLAHSEIESFVRKMYDAPYDYDDQDPLSLKEFRKLCNGYNSPVEISRRTLFVWNSTILNNAYGRFISRYTYDAIKAIIVTVEGLMIDEYLTEDFTTELRNSVDLYIERNDSTLAENKLISLLRKAIAYITIHYATYQNLVELSGNRVVIKEKIGEQGHKDTSTPAADRLSAFAYSNDVTARRYMKQIEDFMYDNYDDFSIITPPEKFKERPTDKKENTHVSRNNHDKENDNKIVRL